jgi:hypothetical protein
MLQLLINNQTIDISVVFPLSTCPSFNFSPLGGGNGASKRNNALNSVISAYADSLKSYKVKIADKEQTAYQMSQLIMSQKQAIQSGILEREALRKLNLKTINELTKTKLTLKLARDSVKHTGTVITIHDTLYKERNCIILPFDFGEKNNFVDMEGNFDSTGVMSFYLSVPINVDLYTGIDKKKTAKSVVTIDNPYVVLNSIQSVRLDLPKERRWGMGAFAGYGIGLSGTIKAQPFVGIGMSYSILRF